MKIGILGGSFNPVHIGHLAIAEEALSMLSLDEMYLIPAFIPPHKQDLNLLSATVRLHLLHEATKNTMIKVSSYEIDRAEVSYTIDTIRYFKRNNDVVLCVGADSALHFETWKAYKEILSSAQVAVYPRPGTGLDDVRKKWQESFLYCDMPLLDISSTDIRERIIAERPYRWFVPQRVWEIIDKERLFQ